MARGLRWQSLMKARADDEAHNDEVGNDEVRNSGTHSAEPHNAEPPKDETEARSDSTTSAWRKHER